MTYFISKIIFSLQLLSLVCGDNSNLSVTCKKEILSQADGSSSMNITLYFPKADGSTLNFIISFKSLDKDTLKYDCAMMNRRLLCIGAGIDMQLDDGVFKAYNLKSTDEEVNIRYNQDRNISCTSLKVSSKIFVTSPSSVGSDLTGLSTGKLPKGKEAAIGLAVGITILVVVAVLLIIFVCKRCKKRRNKERKLSQLELKKCLPVQNTLTNVATDV